MSAPAQSSADAAWCGDVLERIRGGDPAAEAELVERFQCGLSYLLRRLAGDPALAEDLRQETLRLVIEKARRGEIREPERLAGFVRGTAKHLLTAERRRARHRHHEPVDEAPEPADPAATPFDRVAAAEDRRRVRKVLTELASPRDREAVYRIHLAEEDRQAVARDLGLTSAQLSLCASRARSGWPGLRAGRTDRKGSIGGTDRRDGGARRFGNGGGGDRGVRSGTGFAPRGRRSLGRSGLEDAGDDQVDVRQGGVFRLAARELAVEQPVREDVARSGASRELEGQEALHPGRRVAVGGVRGAGGVAAEALDLEGDDASQGPSASGTSRAFDKIPAPPGAPLRRLMPGGTAFPLTRTSTPSAEEPP